jgi:hypothetical protein
MYRHPRRTQVPVHAETGLRPYLRTGMEVHFTTSGEPGFRQPMAGTMGRFLRRSEVNCWRNCLWATATTGVFADPSTGSGGNEFAATHSDRHKASPYD